MGYSKNSSASVRIQWLHKKIANMYYPNAMRLSEKFGISHRQAQRDVDYLKKELGAPIMYSAEHKGFYYTDQFSLPLVLSSDSETALSDMIDSYNRDSPSSEQEYIQMQIPYTATLEITDKLAVLSMKKYIISKESRNRYICEFQSIEQFLSLIMTTEANIIIVEPFWIRERLVKLAENVIKNNRF